MYICHDSQAQQLEPENKAAINQITLCKQEIKKQNDKEKKMYANMFTKFADADKKVCWRLIERFLMYTQQ